MKIEKIRIAIFTAKNLVTSSDCSPETINNLLNTLDSAKYCVDIILIDEFVPTPLQTTEDKLLTLPMYIPFKRVFAHKNLSRVLKLESLTLEQIKNMYDMAIVAVYNDLGEDGKIIGLLDLVGIPYLSPSLKVSAVCFDKSYAKALISQNGGKVPPGFLVHKDRFNKIFIDKKIIDLLGYPVVIKPASSGNSYGASLVRSMKELDSAGKAAFEFSDELLVEKLIEGQEYTVGVVGFYLNPIALPVVQINSKKEFFDYEAKYTTSKADELCPAPIDDRLKHKLQKAALIAYQAVKGDGHARIDMIYSRDENVYVLDINTFPGLNSASLFPKELRATGSSLKKFLEEQIKLRLCDKKTVHSPGK